VLNFLKEEFYVFSGIVIIAYERVAQLQVLTDAHAATRLSLRFKDMVQVSFTWAQEFLYIHTLCCNNNVSSSTITTRQILKL
jgi:hypothetical protein